VRHGTCPECGGAITLGQLAAALSRAIDSTPHAIPYHAINALAPALHPDGGFRKSMRSDTRDDDALIGVFQMLIKGHAERRQPPVQDHARDQLETLQRLLLQFGEIANRVTAEAESQAVQRRDIFNGLLTGYTTAFENYRRKQEDRADDFNLLDVLQLMHKEIRHSMVLAWLLDHDFRRLGTHAQGSLGFRLFLSEMGMPTSFADCGYVVRREVSGDEAIVDIEVSCRNRFLIQKENKIWSSEGDDQTNREWADLQRRAAELGLADASPESLHALFLSPNGTKPANPRFVAVRWSRIARVLEHFAELAKPVDVRLFAAHYARALRRFIVRQDEKEMEGDGTAK
jgi:hypothetical protein